MRQLRRGDPVICEREQPAVGTWSRYAGRPGWVVRVNRQQLPDNATYTEIGVAWRPPSERNPSVDAWFLPSELRLAAL